MKMIEINFAAAAAVVLRQRVNLWLLLWVVLMACAVMWHRYTVAVMFGLLPPLLLVTVVVLSMQED